MCVFKCRRWSYAFGGNMTCFSRYTFNSIDNTKLSMVKWLLFQLVFEELIAENKISISTHEPRDVFVNEHTFLKSDFSC